MRIDVGQIEALYRYPVKSMRGVRVERASLGWHGLEGDRRFALRRRHDSSDFPWVTAGRVPRLVLFTPREDERGALTSVLTPDGVEMATFGNSLAAEIEQMVKTPVEMMQLKHGIFDEASVSIITSNTVGQLGRLSDTQPDVRRFRPNIVIRTVGGGPFEEDGWVGGSLTFGAGDNAPCVSVTMRDLRCSMINIDADEGTATAAILKTVARANQTMAGAYATVTRTGLLAVGQTVFLNR